MRLCFKSNSSHSRHRLFKKLPSKELDTLKLQAREHARYISSLENANEKLETTIKSLRAQISALQKELIKPKGVEDKVNADVKKRNLPVFG